MLETEFDDRPDENAVSGGGRARSLTLNLGGVGANGVRMDFWTDAEWLFLGEVAFRGTPVPETKPIASLTSEGGTTFVTLQFEMVAGLWYRVLRTDSLPVVQWTEVQPGWRQGLGLPMEVRTSLGQGQQGYFWVEIATTSEPQP